MTVPNVFVTLIAAAVWHEGSASSGAQTTTEGLSMKTLTTTLLASATAFGLAAGAHAQTAFSLGDGGATLVSFSPSATGTATATGAAITGADGAAVSLDAITFRPQTGELYGYDGATGSLYVVDPASGVATLAFQSDELPGGAVEFDTNPNLDAFRFVNAAGENVVYFPANTADTMGRGGLLLTAAGEPDAISNITYGEGYDDGLSGPQIIGNGYENQLPLVQAQAIDDLEQYVLDAATDTLGVLNNNAGTVDFDGDVTLAGTGVGIDFTAGAFDVYTDADGNNVGYALLQTVAGVAFYQIGIEGDQAGVATLIGLTGISLSGLTSLAVFDAVGADAVPVPAAALLFLTGAGGIAAARKRKRAAA